MDIQAKVAVVTGASSGLGKAISDAVIQKGGTVYGLARSAEKLGALHQQLGKAFIPVALDISDRKTVNAWVNECFENIAAPDILINNAGAGYFGKINELPLEHWHEMIETNLNGMFYLTSAIVALMKRKKAPAHIVNIGSVLGKTGSSERSGYCATKFGVQGFTEALGKELRYDGIKVTAINPGSINTGFFEASGVKPHENMLDPEAIANLMVQVLETPNNMQIDEISVRPLNPRPVET